MNIIKNSRYFTIFKFLIVGFCNAIIGLGTIYSLMFFISLNYLYSNAAGFCVGILSSYLLNKNWTFQLSDDHAKSFIFIKFLFIILPSYLMNILFVYIFNKYLYQNIYFSQLIGVFIYSVLSYIGLKKFTFRK